MKPPNFDHKEHRFIDAKCMPVPSLIYNTVVTINKISCFLHLTLFAHPYALGDQAYTL